MVPGIDQVTFNTPERAARCWHEAFGFDRVPGNPYRGSTPVRMCCCWMSCVFVVHNVVFSKDRYGSAGGVPT